MLLSYAQGRKRLPAAVRLSQALLAAGIASPLLWYFAASAIGRYFQRTGFQPMLPEARDASRLIDTLPQLVVMTTATVGATLAGLHARRLARARLLVALHVVVYLLSVYVLVWRGY